MFREYKAVKLDGEPVFIFGLDETRIMDIHNYPKGVALESISRERFDELNERYKKEWHGED